MEAVSPRTYLFGLTADEWFALACLGQDSEVAPCCGDIGQLRECLQALATCQGEGEAPLMFRSVLEAYEVARDSHADSLPDRETFPLLHRVLAAIRAEEAAREAAFAEARARSRARLGHLNPELP